MKLSPGHAFINRTCHWGMNGALLEENLWAWKLSFWTPCHWLGCPQQNCNTDSSPVAGNSCEMPEVSDLFEIQKSGTRIVCTMVDVNNSLLSWVMVKKRKWTDFVFFSVLPAVGAVRQRGPEGTGLPEDHLASHLWKVPGVAGLHQEADQQHFLTVSERLKSQRQVRIEVFLEVSSYLTNHRAVKDH